MCIYLRNSYLTCCPTEPLGVDRLVICGNMQKLWVLKTFFLTKCFISFNRTFHNFFYHFLKELQRNLSFTFAIIRIIKFAFSPFTIIIMYISHTFIISIWLILRYNESHCHIILLILSQYRSYMTRMLTFKVNVKINSLVNLETS